LVAFEGARGGGREDGASEIVVAGRWITLQFVQVRGDSGGRCDLSSLDVSETQFECEGDWVAEEYLGEDDDVDVLMISLDSSMAQADTLIASLNPDQ
jgi:hypothetical protein